MILFRKFQNKLFTAYSAILFLLTLLILIPLYVYLHGNIEKNIKVSVEQVIIGISSNLDLFGSQYNNITKQLYLSSDTSGKTPIQYLNMLYLDHSAMNRFRTSLSLNSFMGLNLEIYPEIHRITIFQTNGEIFSNLPYDIAFETARGRNRFEDAMNANGATVIQILEKDDWLSRSGEPVVSFVRLLRYNETKVGFLEIQFPLSQLLSSNALMNLPEGGIWIMNESEILYRNRNVLRDLRLRKEEPMWQEIIKQENGRPNQFVSMKQDDQYFAAAKSEQTGLSIAYSVSEQTLFYPLNTFRATTILSVTLLISISLGVYYMLSRILTAPIRNLKKALDQVTLDEPTRSIRMDNKYKIDEIESLNRSFQKMNERLKNSVTETIRYQTLQYRTHFAKLQSQINPHFLFNMLGVITGMADRKGETEIATIGRKFADFLRYTTTTDPQVSTIGREIQFVRDYLDLMKSRYQSRLQFEIAVPEDLFAIPIPPLTLQPLVENSIQHGFHPRTHVLTIRVTGILHPDNRWEILIRDDGAGFDEAVLDRLHHEIDHYFERLSESERELQIGGMGLISTLARLRFIYKEDLSFSFGNHPGGGAYVSIAGTIQSPGNEVKA